MSLQSVHVIGTGSFLPGVAVTNDQIDLVLGRLDAAPPKVRAFVDNLGPKMLQRGGIERRHFAVDPESHELTHTFASLAEVAARQALDAAGVEPGEIELLILSCPSYDQSTPPTSTILQERLGIANCAEMEIHSNCSGVGKGVQVAYDAIRCGRYRTALVCYSQLSSVYLRSCYYNQPAMDKVHAALRWILADGSGAVVLRAGDGKDKGHEMLGTFVESIGADRPPGMTAGGAAADLIRPDHQIPELYAEGGHHLWQDLSEVNNSAAPLLLQGLMRFTRKMDLPSSRVDHYIVSIPTRQLYDQHIDEFLRNLEIGPSQLKFRSGEIGYCGGAATLIHFDQIVRSGELKPGQIAVVHSVESSKWMTAGFAVRW